MGGRVRNPEQTQGHAQKQKKNFKGRPSSALGTQTATATKVADFRKYPLSKTPKTRVLKIQVIVSGIIFGNVMQVRDGRPAENNRIAALQLH